MGKLAPIKIELGLRRRYNSTATLAEAAPISPTISIRHYETLASWPVRRLVMVIASGKKLNKSHTVQSHR